MKAVSARTFESFVSGDSSSISLSLKLTFFSRYNCTFLLMINFVHLKPLLTVFWLTFEFFLFDDSMKNFPRNSTQRLKVLCNLLSQALIGILLMMCLSTNLNKHLSYLLHLLLDDSDNSHIYNILSCV